MYGINANLASKGICVAIDCSGNFYIESEKQAGGLLEDPTLRPLNLQTGCG